jgi:16S rRNA C1402 (ribose-2'-O) methylase RsmI
MFMTVKSGHLAVVSTPIGNLGDLSPRAAKALEKADILACEDTRMTRKLLALSGHQTAAKWAQNASKDIGGNGRWIKCCTCQ